MLAIPLALIVVLIIFALKDWFLKYIRQSKAYANVPCPPNRLPLLGNLLSLPIGAYGKTRTEKTKISLQRDGSLF